jgi:hypothetical protein
VISTSSPRLCPIGDVCSLMAMGCPFSASENG